MTTPLAYGIDFGTTNSSISIAWPNKVELVQIDGSDVMPSVVLLDSTRNRLAGQQALKQFSVTRGDDSRLFSGIKNDLSDPNFKDTEAPWGGLVTIEQLVAIVLKRLKECADRQSGHDVKRLVIGHPVVWVGAEGQGFERKQKIATKRLEKAARLAGFDEVVLLDEPTAALMAEDPASATMLAVDFGGGTFDVSIIRIEGGEWTVLQTQGAAIGGELFTSQLFDLKLAKPLGLRDQFRVNGKMLPVPKQLWRIRTLRGALQLPSDSATLSAIQFLTPPKGSAPLKMFNEIVFEGHAVPFHQAVEDAKVALSSSATTTIDFRRPRVEINEPVSRSEFEGAIAANIRVVRDQIEFALRKARLPTAKVDLVIRTGGSSNLPLFCSMLCDLFGNERVQARDAFATVALGLAHHGTKYWG